MRVEIKKNKSKDCYELRMYIGELIFINEFSIKEQAQNHLYSIKREIDRNKLRKLKATLPDGEISKLSYELYPTSTGGFSENMLRDLLRKEFGRTARFVRDKFLEINLAAEEEEEIMEP